MGQKLLPPTSILQLRGNVMNQKEKYVLQLQKKARQRKKDKVFIVEGPKMFQELPKERLLQTFVSESFLENNRQFLDGVSYHVVKDSVFADLSDTKTPQGILAIGRQYEYELDDLFQAETPLLLILDTIQDPGNLGTMFRAGEAAGISGVLMNQETVDIYNPKVIRSTMGSLYRVPFYYSSDFIADINRVKKKGIRLYAAHLGGKISYDQMSYQMGTGFLIGNESKGLQKQIADLADHYIKIPMCGQVESLNAAVASSILLFEAARQRRN